jgi:hypothetical protein
VSEESTIVTHPFLDLAPLSAAHFASIEDPVARLLATEQDVVIAQGAHLVRRAGLTPSAYRAQFSRIGTAADPEASSAA